MGSSDPIAPATTTLVLFDGVCNLCNGAVQFIIKRDPYSRFRFASLQSEAGKAQLIKAGLSPEAFHSIVVIEGDKVFQRSDAAFKIAASLSGLWPTLTVFKVVPRFLRDAVYNLVAGSRYRLFGKQDNCMIPDESMKARFVE